MDEILQMILDDNSKARLLDGNGRYSRPKVSRATKTLRSQFEFIDLAQKGGASAEHAQSIQPRVKLAPKPSALLP